jgi:hypothetical protein
MPDIWNQVIEKCKKQGIKPPEFVENIDDLWFGDAYKVYNHYTSEIVYCPDMASYRIDNMLRKKYNDWD